MERESLFSKISRFNRDITSNLPEDISFFKKIRVFFDFVVEWKFHGVYLLDYIQYGFYWKTKPERRKYFVHGRLIEMMQRANNPEHRYIFDQKPEFDKKFADFLQRDWIDTKDANLSDFIKFLDGKDTFFAKDPCGMFGLGVKKVSVSEIEDVEKCFEEYKKQNILCEESLNQCKEMSDFNDTSINSIRVVSFVRANGEVEIIGALLRIGRKGKIADNFHHMGIASYVDPKTGIVCTKGLDKNNDWHIFHPDSNTQIVGFQVPIWNEVVDTIKRAAKVVPDMRYIGWDVVITKDYKVELVEGNPGADPDAEQITTKEGRWPYYKQYLDEL
ncbi:sugar-transfer associated ATP-grasp domain-containing protein [uncultured Parvimonas sp.]|mgnify:CR=1 FL=1|uniref:sugar-transfer associated ATP-grasp domain-containing protein n=1 Tax=uncultured Parvimonas sp. TaxID=747372 RepID=UPI001CABC0A6|nr:sugar-transfer associated ATP-grasp domain-containing protein [uncultured Parvimonas sp.]MBF1299852.1 hexapeptide transferase [Parvimonas sp.]